MAYSRKVAAIGKSIELTIVESWRSLARLLTSAPFFTQNESIPRRPKSAVNVTKPVLAANCFSFLSVFIFYGVNPSVLMIQFGGFANLDA
jgi:hypothetical protein